MKVTLKVITSEITVNVMKFGRWTDERPKKYLSQVYFPFLLLSLRSRVDSFCLILPRSRKCVQNNEWILRVKLS